MADKVSAKVVDFSNVKDGGGSFNTVRVPAGDYLAKIIKVEDAQSKKDDSFQYLFTIQLNQYSQNRYPYYCKLQENQLWKLRNLLIAAGMTVPKKRMKLDPNKVVGKTIGVTMDDDEYEGKLKSVVGAVFPAAELTDGQIVSDDDDDVAEEEDEVSMDDIEEPEAEEGEADELAGMDRAELKAAIKELNADFRAKKSQTDDDLRDILTDLRADSAPADDEEEEEEEEAPAPKKKAAAKGKKKKASEVTDDELEELDIDDL